MRANKGVMVIMSLGLLLAACAEDDVVTPAGVPSVSFFADWDIASASRGNGSITCGEAGGSLVYMTVWRETEEVARASVFACDLYQGLSVQQFASNAVYDIRLDLLSPFNAILASVFFDDQFIAISGTVDLGRVTFFVP